MILGSLAPAVWAGEGVQVRTDWIPLLRLNLNLFLDALGLMSAAMILGIVLSDNLLLLLIFWELTSPPRP